MEPQNQKFVFCPKIIELSYLVKAIFGQIPNVTQCENFDFTDTAHAWQQQNIAV